MVTRREMVSSGLALGTAVATPAIAYAAAGSVERWGVYDVALPGAVQENPFDLAYAIVFERDALRIRVPAFFDGDGVFRVRFSPPEIGQWRWRTEGLAPATGAFECVAPRAGNRGPVRVTADGYHFAYADGTPFRQIGTTSYSWALQSDAKCAETLTTLARSPFNKIRMCLFPNVESVATRPFAATGGGLKDWDPTRLDPPYFRRFEDRIRRLGALGIEADLILYHPYDAARGYSDMRRDDDERYLRYVAARFGAFRNVWWAMANEYDLIKTKTMADWDHLFAVLVAADPHDRLRSMHQLRVFYDHRKPWITHASIQAGNAVLDDSRATPHRNFAQKAVIFDEVCYEGNLKLRWGNLTGEAMVERFWWGTIAGTYVGHGETTDPEGNADHSWLGQGGTLKGTSAPRLAFLRKVLEEGPRPGIEPLQPFWDYHLGGKDGEYYLRYFGAEPAREWRFSLPKAENPDGARYRAEILDTWNMTVTPVEGIFTMAKRDAYDVHDPSRPAIALPGKPWIAVRVRRV
jgi:hypothetical protein